MEGPGKATGKSIAECCLYTGFSIEGIAGQDNIDLALTDDEEDKLLSEFDCGKVFSDTL